MPAWLHVLALAALIAVFGVSAALLGNVIGRTSPWLAVLLMFYFLAVAKLAEPLVVLRVPRWLYPLRPWEVEGRVLRRLGVLGFGKVLRETPLRYLNGRVYLDGARPDPGRVLAQAASGEACHFWAAVLLLPFVGVAAVAGRWGAVAGFVVAEMLVNVYPILHLRHVRGRLGRALRKMGGRGVG